VAENDRLREENKRFSEQIAAVVDEFSRTITTQLANWNALTRQGLLSANDPKKIAKRVVQTERRTRTELIWQPAAAPEISVVLGTYQRLPLLKTVIDSIRSNGISAPYEIIVIDGGSTDGTAEWLTQQPDILTIVHHNRQEGIRQRSWGWFMNVGFRASHGRCILMISDDTILVPGAVNAGLARLAELEKAERMIGGIAFYFRNWPMEKSYFVQKTIGGMLMVNHGLFVRDALEAVGYCEEEAFSFYKCDSDLALKLWSAGYEIADCQNALIEHFMLPDEYIRQENSQTMAHDREVLLDRWNGVYAHRILNEMFKVPEKIEITYDDPFQTAEAFREFLPTEAENDLRRQQATG